MSQGFTKLPHCDILGKDFYNSFDGITFFPEGTHWSYYECILTKGESAQTLKDIHMIKEIFKGEIINDFSEENPIPIDDFVESEE